MLREIIVHFGGIKFRKAMRGETLSLIQPRISEIKCYQPVVVYIKARLEVLYIFTVGERTVALDIIAVALNIIARCSRTQTLTGQSKIG